MKRGRKKHPGDWADQTQRPAFITPPHPKQCDNAGFAFKNAISTSASGERDAAWVAVEARDPWTQVAPWPQEGGAGGGLCHQQPQHEGSSLGHGRAGENNVICLNLQLDQMFARGLCQALPCRESERKWILETQKWPCPFSCTCTATSTNSTSECNIRWCNKRDHSSVTQSICEDFNWDIHRKNQMRKTSLTPQSLIPHFAKTTVSGETRETLGTYIIETKTHNTTNQAQTKSWHEALKIHYYPARGYVLWTQTFKLNWLQHQWKTMAFLPRSTVMSNKYKRF